jgi:son of sevenless-like protein
VIPSIPGDSLGASSAIILKRTSAKALALQMTILDADTFGEIKPEEMLLGNWTRPNKEEVAPTLTYLANYFNQWSYWVSTDILIAGSLNAQVQAVKKFISVLHHLFSLNNFNSLMAVMSGLNRASVSRLKKVWARVPIKFVELFHQLEDLMTPLGNFKYYRQLLAESKDKKPIVPYLVVFLRDLTFINDGNEERLPMPQKPDVKLPNFEKMVLLGQQILELEAYRKVPYTLDGDSSVATALRNAMYFDEDTLHRLSLEQEPIQNMEPEMDYLNDDETISNEKKTKNPLLALQQMREELLAESNEFDFSEGSENWAHDEDKTDDGTASKLEDKSE